MIKKSMGKTFDQGLQLALADGLHVRCTRHTSHVTRHTSHVTRHTSHVTRHTSHVTHHTSHVTRHTSHVTRHTSHVTRHTSHRYWALLRMLQIREATAKTLCWSASGSGADAAAADSYLLRSAIRVDESSREDILGGEHSIVADTWKTISAVYRCWLRR
jgi:hypothetical protein